MFRNTRFPLSDDRALNIRQRLEPSELGFTASGKLLLAHLPPAERDTLIGKLTLTRMTRHTITAA